MLQHIVIINISAGKKAWKITSKGNKLTEYLPVCPLALSSSCVSSGNSMSSSSKVYVPDEDVLGFLRSSEKKEQVNI